MGTLLLLLIFPLIWPFVSKLIWPREISWGEISAQVVIVSLIVAGVYQLGRFGKTSDIEIHNGQVIQKHRDHGEYTESYQCNCYTTCSGSGNNRSCSQHCSTCYREHYTVKWYLSSTVGTISIDNRDWTSRAVYALPNPGEYEHAWIGEPCSKPSSFTNYIKAVPESLFGQISKLSRNKFPGKIPTYPLITNIYHIARVINVGANLDSHTLTLFNDQLNEANKTLGPSKQANVIVIVTNITDPMYRYSVENAWLGGKKNDVVVFIGSSDGQKIDWVDVMTWALNRGNGLFHATLRDDLLSIGRLDSEKLVSVISSDTARLFTRPHMKDFEYLDKEIEPPTWVLILGLILGILCSLGCTFFFWKIVHDQRGYYRSRY